MIFAFKSENQVVIRKISVKYIDPKFVHYGIRKDDLAMIEAICEAEGVDFDWLSEDILKAYHAKKVDVIEMSDNETEDIIRNAIQKIRQ